MQKWKCKCGKENSGKFCVACGEPKPADAKPAWICTCGQENTGKFCIACGKDMVSALQQSQSGKAASQFPTEPTASLSAQGIGSRRPQVTGSQGTGSHRNGKFIRNACVLVAVLAIGIIGYLIRNHVMGDDNASGNTEPAKVQQEEALASQQNEETGRQKEIHEPESDLSLGGICIGYNLDKVHSLIGMETGIEEPGGGADKRYQYRDMEVVVTNGVVTALVSKTDAAKTKRGIHQGSRLQDVVAAYGTDCTKSEYQGTELYEYSLYSIVGDKCLLRFAIKGGVVDYISARVVSPPAPPSVSTSPNVESAKRTFYAYWDNLNKRNFPAAYGILSYNQQNRIGAFESYRSGYDNTLSSEAKITGTSEQNGTVYINYTLRAEDREGAGVRVQIFSGTAAMTLISNRWRIESMAANRVETFMK